MLKNTRLKFSRRPLCLSLIMAALLAVCGSSSWAFAQDAGAAPSLPNVANQPAPPTPGADASKTIKAEVPPPSQVSPDAQKIPDANGKILAPLPSLAPMVKKARPAVVYISTVKVVRARGPFGGPRGNNPFIVPPFGFDDDFFNNFYGNAPREYKERAMGSGFIFDPEGYILTNNHVVDGAEEIKVKLDDGQNLVAEVIGKDPKTDLALLKLTKPGVYNYISFGDSDKAEIGDWVVAIGNPYGLEHTVTSGILSAKQRNLGGSYDAYLQTDASINPGNSGGPLINLTGEVIGINSMIAASGSGIGFAIPSSMAIKIVDKLKKTGRVDRGWLGVYIQEVTPDLAKAFGLDEPQGALIGTIQPNSPAEEAKFQHGDVVLVFDGKPIKSYSELSAYVADTDVGKTCDVIVWREGKRQTVKVKLGLLPDDSNTLAASGSTPQDLGLSVSEILPDRARSLGMDPYRGLFVENVLQESPAALGGILPGDVILEIDRKKVNTISDYQKILREHDRKEAFIFFVKRKDSSIYLSVQIPSKGN